MLCRGVRIHAAAGAHPVDAAGDGAVDRVPLHDLPRGTVRMAALVIHPRVLAASDQLFSVPAGAAAFRTIPRVWLGQEPVTTGAGVEVPMTRTSARRSRHRASWAAAAPRAAAPHPPVHAGRTSSPCLPITRHPDVVLPVSGHAVSAAQGGYQRHADQPCWVMLTLAAFSGTDAWPSVRTSDVRAASSGPVWSSGEA